MTGTPDRKFKISLRKAKPEDVDLLITLGKRCFHEAFDDVTAPDDMKAYLKSTFRTSTIQSQLLDDHALIFIAEVGADPAGYIYSHPAVPPECVRDKEAVKLERLYLRKPYYGRAVGDALMQTSLEAYRSQNFQTVWLSSWELNDRANAFYKKWGFTIVGNQKFTVGRDIQNDYILSRRI